MASDPSEPGSSPRPASADGSTTVELTLGGMHCQSCVALIHDTLIRDPAVHSASVDLDTARASVVFDGSSLSVDDLCAAVVSAGYSATPLASDDRLA
jgi:copper chaperone CopZ